MVGFLLAISVVLLAINGVFVMVEFALVRVRTSRMEMLARGGSTRARLVQEILGQMDMYLAAIQTGITVVSLATGWLGEPALAELLSGGLEHLPFTVPPQALHAISFGTALLLLTFAHIVLSELIPRSIGIQRAEPIMLWASLPLKAYVMGIRMPVAFMSRFSVGVLRLLGYKAVAETEHENVVSEEEMRILLSDTQEKGTIPLERLMLLENLFDFGSTKASEAMVPIEKVAFLHLNKPWEENLETIRSRRFSRYPVCAEGPQDVVGFIHVKDLILKADGGVPDVKALRRDIAVVAENDSLEKLVKSFPDRGIQLAMVADAEGRRTGLITLEDIVEELIGEVQDEFDLPQAWSLMDVIVPEAVTVGIAAADRKEAIEQIMARLKAACPELADKDPFTAVWDREARFPSGVGHGVAVPHARIQGLSRAYVAVGRMAKPVPFLAPDNIPARLVFLILTPTHMPILQLKILARIASMAGNESLRRKLARSKASESMLEILRTADTLLAS